MTIRLYDSRAQALVDFEPLVPGQVGLYVCGPTVQSSPHIGHLRSALVYDLWRRWFTYRGLDVTLVRNVTDIDDKILALAAGTDEQWWARAYRYELEFTAGYQALGILAPTYEPRATASISEMQQIVERLIERGHAYAADDASGDVYFDTASWPAYGALTRQDVADMASAADADPRGKRDPRDFALWKGAKADEPASAAWSSPWGEGRPGWHIECSAMSRRYLGPAFDIHGGGLDLRFPHHENELAQSTAAGDGFARHWLHNGLVNVDGQKMSKSLGNSIFAAEFLEKARPVVVRYFLSAAHYRSTIDYHDGALVEADAALDRVETFLSRAERRLAGTRFASVGARVVPDDFAAAMDDDLNVPQAIAVLHDAVRAGNSALDDGDLDTAAREWQHVAAMVAVLGIDPLAPEWRDDDEGAAHRALGAVIDVLLAERQHARADRDFARADQIRSTLSGAGILIEDTPSGSHWSLEQ
ncbi:cysteine--tRNA ligase [Frigoribacterium sp. CFBP9039]|uniref:cysteine--tRNA ligase n=1 Tax=Frigoribacterium TaxID=96492 RepID=UPI00177FED26|nr:MULTISPECIES: cysteine--tRNA ligase [Frigoribacterium]MBD8704485.1 cysteine--tRNA ligase [Frigoribacterium sp. CFBP 13712]MCJ0701949.1 cysteine--tRNA ligase [Frigoribacterium faeni]MDY0945584.1 cysteine--tRNA ligase [Frigoribacterium sp. CFBP9039]